MWGCTYNGASIGHWFFGGGILGFGFTGLIIIIIVALAVKIIRAPQRRKPKNFDAFDSLMILKSRFAKGEVSEQEYKKMKEALSA